MCNRTDSRGIVLAATYEARPFGIRAGTPVFKAKKMCPQGIILQSNFDKYEMISNRMMAIFRQFSPDVEICSIDEAYVDLTGLRMLYRTDYAGIGELIQKKIFAELGITISIGIASNKLLAKIASDFKKPSGLTAVTGFNRKEFLKKIPIGDIPGIGKNTAALLTKYGFKTAHDISISEKIPLLLGKRGEYLSKELNGECVSKIKNTKALPLSLSNTRTFPDFTYDKNYIYTFSLNLLLGLSLRLREYGLQAKTMGFFLMTKDFKTFGLKQKIIPPTDDDTYLIPAFKMMFEKTFKTNLFYRKSGFFLSDLTRKSPYQCTLFEIPQRGNLSLAIDSIYKRFGSKGITRGALL